MAALIMAMWDGIERKLDPGEPEERNIYEAMEAGKQVKKIPMTFGDALDALEADEVVKSALPGEMYTCLHALQARRVGALLRHRHRLGREGVPRRSAVSASEERLKRRMCGIAGIIYRDGSQHPIGDEMTRMLQSMKHRGPDSTGYALYGQPGERLRSSCATSSRTRTRRATSSSRTGCGGTASRSRRGSHALGARDPRGRGGDAVRVPRLVRLRRRPEAARRLRRGHPRGRGALARAARSRSSRTSATPRPCHEQYGLDDVHRHARDRPRAHGDRVRGRHRRRAPVLGVPVLRRRGRPQRPADELLHVAPPPRARRPPLHVRVRLRDHRRLPRRGDDRRAPRSRRRCTSRSTSSTASSRTSR